MKYEQFIERLKVGGIEIPDNSCLECYWVVGGDKGGDCYGHKYGPMEPEEEPDFEALDAVLAIVCPSITYLQYKDLERNLSRRRYTQRDGYYGRFEDRAAKSILLRELHAWLEEKRLLGDLTP